MHTPPQKNRYAGQPPENQFSIGFLLLLTTAIAAYLSIVNELTATGTVFQAAWIFIAFALPTLIGFEPGKDRDTGRSKLGLRFRLMLASGAGMLGSFLVLLLLKM